MGWAHPQAVTFSVPCSAVCFLVSESSHFGVPNHGADLPGSPAVFLASCFGISKNIPLLFKCKIRTSSCFLLHQWTEWSKELLCECIKQKHDLSCNFLSVPAVRAWAVFSQEAASSSPLRACPLPPKLATLQPHQHKGILPSSTQLFQLKTSFAGPVSALLYFMLKSCIEKGQDQTAHYISSLSTVSRLSAKISIIS